MMTLTKKEMFKAIKTLPVCDPINRNDLFWFIKDFYQGKGFVTEEIFNYTLKYACEKNVLITIKINNEKNYYRAIDK